MAFWQDSRATSPGDPSSGFAEGDTGVNTIGTGASANVTGIMYFPSQALLFSGGRGTACTQMIAFAIQFLHDAHFTYGNCSGAGGAADRRHGGHAAMSRAIPGCCGIALPGGGCSDPAAPLRDRRDCHAAGVGVGIGARGMGPALDGVGALRYRRAAGRPFRSGVGVG
jgi:hypothetical protein